MTNHRGPAFTEDFPTYVPVTPESGVVHRHSHPEHASDTRTVCGVDGSWVKTFTFLPASAVFCATCWTPQTDWAEAEEAAEAKMMATVYGREVQS